MSPARGALRRARPATDDDHAEIVATARDSGFLAMGSFFEFASRFVIALLLARVLGAQDYGLYVLGISAATLFSAISLLGLDDAMVRYVAILSARGDEAGVRGALQIGLGVTAVSATAMGVLLYVAAGPVASGLFDEPELAPLLRIFAVLVPFLTLSNMLAGIARGFRRMGRVAFAENVAQSLVRMALLAIAAAIGGLGTESAAVVFGVADVAATAVLVVGLDRDVPLAGLLRGARRDVREVLQFALPLWLSGLLRQFRRNIQTIMIGATGSIAAVGVYEVVDKVNLVGHVWLLSVLVAVKPALAQLHDRGDRDGLRKLYTTATRWTLSVNLPFLVVTVLYRDALLGVFGDAFAAGATALVLLSLAEAANAATGICGPMIDMTGHTRVKLANSLLWTVLLVGCGAVLIPRWGIEGAATAALVAIATVNVLCIVEVRVLEGLLPYDRTFLRPLAAGAGAFATGIALDRAVAVDGRLSVAAIQAAVVVAVYVSALVALGLEADDRAVLASARGASWRRRDRRVPPVAVHERIDGEVAMPQPRHDAAPPIYIGGLDRSGKSTMAGFLTTHPHIDIPPVGSNMWTYFHGRFGDLSKRGNLDRCLDELVRYTHVALLEPDPDRLRRELAGGTVTYARLFELVHRHAAERAGKVRWGTQTGLIERYADELFDAYGDVKVIHMVRDPRDRYEGSLALWPSGRGRAGGATARWNYSLRLAERNLRRHPGGYTIVRFEDLVREPERTLREVCAFLGEPFLPEMLSMAGAPQRRARMVAGAPRRPDEPPVSEAYIGRFRDAIPAPELAFMQLHAGRRMRRYGYEPAPVVMSRRARLAFVVRDWPDQVARLAAWRTVESLQQRFPALLGRRPDPRLVVGPAEGVR